MFWTSIEASTEIVYSGWDSGVGWQLDMVKSRAKKKKSALKRPKESLHNKRDKLP